MSNTNDITISPSQVIDTLEIMKSALYKIKENTASGGLTQNGANKLSHDMVVAAIAVSDTSLRCVVHTPSNDSPMPNELPEYLKAAHEYADGTLRLVSMIESGLGQILGEFSIDADSAVADLDLIQAVFRPLGEALTRYEGEKTEAGADRP